MEGYLKIYIKNDRIGHVRYEIGDGRGYKEIRGLSVTKPLIGETIYEKGEEDSHGLSVYNSQAYLASEKIPLTREQLVNAIAYTRTNDENPPSYSLSKRNCNDFTKEILSVSGQKGCVGDYLSKAQKEKIRLSNISDLNNCQIPKYIEETKEKVTNSIRNATCNGFVMVKSHMRNGHLIEDYIRHCGRH